MMNDQDVCVFQNICCDLKEKNVEVIQSRVWLEVIVTVVWPLRLHSRSTVTSRAFKVAPPLPTVPAGSSSTKHCNEERSKFCFWKIINSSRNA